MDDLTHYMEALSRCKRERKEERARNITLRDLLQEVIDEANLGDSIIKPDLEKKIQAVLDAES